MAKVIVCPHADCPHGKNPERPMRMIQEYEQSWLFVCNLCLRSRVVTKDKVGGTVGAGIRADGTRVVGKGV